MWVWEEVRFGVRAFAFRTDATMIIAVTISEVKLMPIVCEGPVRPMDVEFAIIFEHNLLRLHYITVSQLSPFGVGTLDMVWGL